LCPSDPASQEMLTRSPLWPPPRHVPSLPPPAHGSTLRVLSWSLAQVSWRPPHPPHPPPPTPPVPQRCSPPPLPRLPRSGDVSARSPTPPHRPPRSARHGCGQGHDAVTAAAAAAAGVAFRRPRAAPPRPLRPAARGHAELPAAVSPARPRPGTLAGDPQGEGRGALWWGMTWGAESSQERRLGPQLLMSPLWVPLSAMRGPWGAQTPPPSSLSSASSSRRPVPPGV
jgi:hypothetical protein